MTAPRTIAYIPERGDLVWTVFDPQVRHEQAGRRPVLVLSPKNYNSRIGLGLFCPITSKIKGYIFEVVLPEDGKIAGAILCDQIKSFDWKTRGVSFVERVSPEIMGRVIGKIRALTG